MIRPYLTEIVIEHQARAGRDGLFAQPPWPPVRGLPSCGVPAMVGGDVFCGLATTACTTAVGAEVASVEPPALVAVTVKRIVEPTSAEVSV